MKTKEKKEFTNFVDFLNKDKGFKQDRKYFYSWEEAKKWCLETMDKFDSDYIKYVD